MAEELSRRDMLMAAMEESEKEPEVQEPEEIKDEAIEEATEASEESVSEKPSNEANRDEKGRFAKKESVDEAISEGDTDEEESEQVEVAKPAIPRPTTWKKEYLPIWDKLTTGEQLTPDEALKLAEYSNQRESEYKKGVSTYKAEADNARGLVEAIAPFIPDLQQQNISPTTWINNLGRAHMILTKAPYEQKVELFQRLAQDYGIQLNNGSVVSAQQLDPQSYALNQQLRALQNEVQQVRGWREQEENQRLQAEIERVRSNTEKFPHFEVVREDMAQLLERGLAQDLETAYAKAVRMNDEVWSMEQERLLAQAKKEASKVQQIAKAKAAAVSPKSVTPNGIAKSGEKKDRRSLIAEQLGESIGRV